MRTAITAILLLSVISVFAQTTISWEVIDDPGTMPEIIIPEGVPPEGVITQEPGDTSALEHLDRPPLPEIDMDAVRAGLEARSHSKMQEKNPPVVLIELTLPASRGDIDRERLMDGHVLRNGRVYMKPHLVFDDPEMRTPIVRIAPLRRDVSASSITTVQEAIDAMDLSYVYHSTKTIEGDLYIDITDIVDGIEHGDITNTMILSPLSPRERFSLPEAAREMGAESGGDMFEVVVTEE